MMFRVFHLLKNELLSWIMALVFSLPGKIGQACRVVWCRRILQEWGSNSRVGKNVIFSSPEAIRFGTGCSIGSGGFFSAEGGEIVVGDNVRFNHDVHINASVGGSISIGSDCLIGPNVVFRTASHCYDDPDIPIRDQGHRVGSITLEQDVWIAANAVILPGVTLGRGCIVGAGSVVTKSVDAMCIVAGIPAKPQKMRPKCAETANSERTET